MNTTDERYGWIFKDSTKDQVKQDLLSTSARIIPKTNDDSAFVIGSNFYGHHQHFLQLDYNFENEIDLINQYREMSMVPEVDKAVNEICNEAIAGDEDSSPVDLILDDLNLSEPIKNKILKEFDSVLKLLNFNSDAYKIFRKWYVDGRLFYLKVIDPKDPKAGIKEARYISSLCMKKIREEKKERTREGVEMTTDYEEYFLYSKNFTGKRSPNVGAVKFAKDSIAYVTSGLYDENTNLVYSHLHKAIKPVNKLRVMEDATIIYRLSRAPERRVFYIDVGNLPKQKAEEYLQGIMKQHKQKMVYDTVTGNVKDSNRVLSMMEDFWLPRREGGKGTEISTLPAGQNLGQMEDVDYFRKALYIALNVPPGRMDLEQQTPFSIGKPGEITRSEINFGRFIDRLQKEFSGLFKDLLRTQLLLKQIITPDDWEVMKEKIAFNFASDSYYTELKESEILKDRVDTLSKLKNEGLIGTFYSETWVRKQVLKQTDEDIERIDKEIAKEKDKKLKEQQDLMKKYPDLYDGENEVRNPLPDQGGQ